MFHRFRRGPARAALLVGSLLLGGVLVACSGAEPDGTPDEESALDESGIESDAAGGEGDGPRDVTFRFAPGSTLANAQVHILNLDSDAAPITAPTDAEGGASFTFSGADGDEIRLQIATDARRYQPTDYVLGQSGGKNTLTKSVRHDCVAIEPGFELGFDTGFAQLSVYNECSGALSLAAPRLRTGSLGADFELVTLMPVEIAGGVSAGIELRMPDAATRPSEDILFLDTEVESERLRYAIGLYAPR